MSEEEVSGGGVGGFVVGYIVEGDETSFVFVLFFVYF